MNIAIFLISVVGIIAICYTVNNYSLLYTEYDNDNDLQIVLYKYNVNNVDKREIVSKIMNGDYSKILDVVDKIHIN